MTSKIVTLTSLLLLSFMIKCLYSSLFGLYKRKNNIVIREYSVSLPLLTCYRFFGTTYQKHSSSLNSIANVIRQNHYINPLFLLSASLWLFLIGLMAHMDMDVGDVWQQCHTVAPLMLQLDLALKKC